MPKLHEYVASSPKSGFYIYAQHNGQNVTYQVTAIAAHIFRTLKYTDGKTLSGEVFFSLHRLGLIYTKKSGVNPPSSFEELEVNSDSQFSRADRIDFFRTLLTEGKLDDDELVELRRYLSKNDLSVHSNAQPSSEARSTTNATIESQSTPHADGETIFDGVVDFFNDTGGYGFINSPASDDDVFYHMEDIGGPDITEGTKVKFSFVQAEKGPRATHITRFNSEKKPTDSGSDITIPKPEEEEPEPTGSTSVDEWLETLDFEKRPTLDQFQKARRIDSNLSITVLGSGSGWPTAQRGLSSIHIERGNEQLLFDAPEGTQRALQQEDLGLDLDAAFLSTVDVEHAAGLLPLLRTMELTGRDSELAIVVPDSAVQQVQKLGPIKTGMDFEISVHGATESPWQSTTYQVSALTDDDGDVAYALCETPQRGRLDINTLRGLTVEESDHYDELRSGRAIELTNERTLDPRAVLGDPLPGRAVLFTGAASVTTEMVRELPVLDVLVHTGGQLAKDAQDATRSALSAGKIATATQPRQVILVGVTPDASNKTAITAETESQYTRSVHLANDGYNTKLSPPRRTAPPLIAGEDVVDRTEIEVEMFIEVDVDRFKNGVGLSQSGYLHIKGCQREKKGRYLVEVLRLYGGHAVAKVAYPPTGTPVARFDDSPKKSKRNRTKQRPNRTVRTKYGNQVTASDSNPFSKKGGKLNSLLRKSG